jgi:tRNA pseudouridine13 synthase
MIIKHIPEDFLVDEIFDLKKISEKPKEKSNFFYFLLKKKNYSQFFAFEKISNIFHTNRKNINFAGTKDRVGITTQLISIRNLKEDNFEKNVEYFNKKFIDLNLEYLGKFNSRVNLSDNSGNKFLITIRDVSDKELKIFEKNTEYFKKKNFKFLNFFDKQRFGFAKNTHLIGKLILQGKVKKAIFEILSSCPPNPNHKNVVFTDYIKENFESFFENVNLIDKAIEICPNSQKDYVRMLNQIKANPNDIFAVFRCISKKLRTLYINSYQSYIFNEILRNFNFEDSEKLNLLNYETKFDEKIEIFVNDLLEKEGLRKNDFKLNSMPELRNENENLRDVYILAENFKIVKIEDDDLFENKKKVIVSFFLKSGSYATNIISQLFENQIS